MLLFKRRYHFAAAHRLHSAHLSDAENKAIFMQCNHPNGHGHNYEFELYLEGELDPTTHMLIDLVTLDELVQTHVLNEVDHVFLDKDTPLFRGVISTAENMARVFFETLDAVLPQTVELVAVRVYECRNNTAIFQRATTKRPLPLIYQY
jgi:6-pyruvoyltetrahydropterin/6-carboxytetrahydropterin synthase